MSNPSPPPAPAPAPAPPLWLPFDLTGASPDNLVSFEFHTAQMGQDAIVKPDYGLFYRESLQMYWQGVGNFLNPMVDGADYVCVEFNSEITELTGKDVYKAILVINPNLSGTYAITYQGLGGSDNVNTSLAFIRSTQSTSDSQPIEYSDIQSPPLTFQPISHQHDLKDIYGTEYIYNFLVNLKAMMLSKQTAYGVTSSSAKDAELWAATTGYKTLLDQATFDLNAAIAEHLATTGHFHAYTAAMIGLGNVSDGGFVPINDIHGNPLPVYASPLSVQTALASLPSPTTTNHRTLTNNPHQDNKTTIGLGNLMNYGMYTTYTLGVSQYQSILTTVAQQKYIAPYVVVEGVGEAQAAQVNTYLTQPTLPVTQTGGGIDTAIATTAGAVSTMTSVTAALATTHTAVAAANAAVASAQAANRAFRMVHDNEPYSELLSALLLNDYGYHASGYSVSPDGYYPTPSLIDNLYLWLDAGYTHNTYQTGTDGKVRLMSMTDRSVNARLFVANNINTAPLYRVSQDVTAGHPGLTMGQVASFSAGKHLDQIAGAPVSIKPGYTIFVVVRPNAGTVPFTIASDGTSVPQTAIAVQPVSGKAIEVLTSIQPQLGTNWTPLVAAAGTMDSSTSTILVASISDTSEAECWFAGCKPIPSAHPRGVDTPAGTWPAPYLQSTPMTRIGNGDPLSLDNGEFSQLIIYNRQLSFAEAQAVIDYLRLSRSNNLALVVDTSAKTQF